MPIKPTLVKDFHKERLDVIERFEGFVDRVYLDIKNIPTIGIGVALGRVKRDATEKDAKPHQVVTLYDADAIDDSLSGVHKITPAEYKALEDLVQKINADGRNGVAPAQVHKNGAAMLDRLYAVKDPQKPESAENKDGALVHMTLTRPQARKLAEGTLNTINDNLEYAYPDYAHLRKDLAGSRELIALDSLAYNSPSLIGPGLRKALQEGDRLKVITEMVYDQKNLDVKGLLDRRVTEANIFGLFDQPAPGAAIDADVSAQNLMTTLKKGVLRNGQNVGDFIQKKESALVEKWRAKHKKKAVKRAQTARGDHAHDSRHAHGGEKHAARELLPSDRLGLAGALRQLAVEHAKAAENVPKANEIPEAADPPLAGDKPPQDRPVNHPAPGRG